MYKKMLTLLTSIKISSYRYFSSLFYQQKQKRPRNNYKYQRTNIIKTKGATIKNNQRFKSPRKKIKILRKRKINPILKKLAWKKILKKNIRVNHKKQKIKSKQKSFKKKYIKMRKRFSRYPGKFFRVQRKKKRILFHFFKIRRRLYKSSDSIIRTSFVEKRLKDIELFYILGMPTMSYPVMNSRGFFKGEKTVLGFYDKKDTKKDLYKAKKRYLTWQKSINEKQITKTKAWYKSLKLFHQKRAGKNIGKKKESPLIHEKQQRKLSNLYFFFMKRIIWNVLTIKIRNIYEKMHKVKSMIGKRKFWRYFKKLFYLITYQYKIIIIGILGLKKALKRKRRYKARYLTLIPLKIQDIKTKYLLSLLLMPRFLSFYKTAKRKKKLYPTNSQKYYKIKPLKKHPPEDLDSEQNLLDDIKESAGELYEEYQKLKRKEREELMEKNNVNSIVDTKLTTEDEEEALEDYNFYIKNNPNKKIYHS